MIGFRLDFWPEIVDNDIALSWSCSVASNTRLPSLGGIPLW
jgi:hypothetical protein